MERTKTCTHCGEEKPITQFSKHKHSPDGHAYQCKECNAKRSKEWRSTPSGIYTNIKGRQEFYKRHRHWRYKPVKISRNEFIDWYNNQDKVCFYCGIHEEELSLVRDTQNTKAKRLTVDCIENNLGYTLDNIVLACGRCNFVKNDFFTHEDMITIGSLFVAPKWNEQKVNQE